EIDSLKDFAFQPTGVINDLCITISPMGNFRAGFDPSYMINYENVGTTTLNGTVIFFPDNNVTFVSSNPIATSVTTDSMVWNVGTLTPFQTGSILVTVHVNAGMPIGTLINSSVRIEPVAGDANTVCNYNAWEVFVTGAVDPNAIIVDRDTVLTTELSSPPYLNYIIYFQNTGNDTAFNARVLNNIPQMLDVNSFEFVGSSHPVNITYGAHARLMTFTFDNILLPDSNVNEPASHGFIRYRIKPVDTLVAGNKIFNKAFIYFDFNQPVETNYAVTEIVLPTGISQQSLVIGHWSLYPNPASQSITIESSLMTNDQCLMTILDLFGRVIYQFTIYNLKSKIKIDVSGFSQGVYFVQLQSGEKVLRGKFLKE
ncbi:MAG: T9SS type A sorting domain-containing protein, partial [Bacteroidota bacterium]